MRIISKFRDYYDSVQMYGQDLSTIYLRKEEMVDFSKVKFDGHVDMRIDNSYARRYAYYSDGHLICSPFAVFLGTNQYLGMKLSTKIQKPGDVNPQEVIDYAYSEEACLSFLKRYLPIYFEKYDQRVRGYKKGTLRYATFFNEQTVKEFFDQPIKQENKNVCIDLECPVVFYGYGFASPMETSEEWKILIKNPCLRNLQFIKALDPNSAFQQIESFLSGVLPNAGKPMVEVSEKTKILKRGFDYKWSFRKRPDTSKT